MEEGMLQAAKLKRFLPIFLIVSILVIALFSDLRQYLNFHTLKQHRQELHSWTEAHFVLASLIFCIGYATAIMVSVPGAAFFTIVGGFVFGAFWGSIYVVFSATLGATLIFLAVRYTFADLVHRKAGGWIAKMRQGFLENAPGYLLFLRLVPIFPFWAVNIVSAVFGVSLKDYVLTTFLGIIPGSLVYVMLGNGLGRFFEKDEMPNLSIIYEPVIFLPLLGLGLLSLLPILIKNFKRKSNHD